MSDTIEWDLPEPFILPWHIALEHIDHYQHVNNVAYLMQVEQLAWAHSNALGLSFADYQACDRAMVIRRHELDYILPSHKDDLLQCATWIAGCDGKLTLTRQFQFVCERRNTTVFRAKTTFVCTSLTTGKPRRMPPAFIEHYVNAVVTG